MKPKQKTVNRFILIPALLFSVFLFVHCQFNRQPANDYKTLRENMVKTQIEARGITDPAVLAAMRNVERHLFVPDEYTERAYGDHPLPIGYRQTISQPYIVAFMSEALKLKPTDKVLEIGTGSGYQAAILGEICDSVFSIEIVKELAELSKKRLQKLGYKNIQVMQGDGYSGWPGHGLYDAIIVTCAPANIPLPLQQQLAEGGRMIIPVGERYTQELVLLTKKKGRMVKQRVLPVMFVPMVDENGEVY